MLIGSIDLNKIDKTKIVSRDKDGKPFLNGAKYLPIVLWVNDEPDKYGNDASIQISQSKEDRESGQKSAYIGNLKSNNQNSQSQQTKDLSQVASPAGEEDDLPF